MGRCLRFVLTCLLALALPVQGHAAQTMLFCGPTHHGDLPAARSHAANGEGQATEHAHHHAAEASSADHHQASLDSEHKAWAAKAGTGKCSACAACCIGVALAPSPLITPVVPLTPAYGVASFEPHVGITTGGLERPPRVILA